MPVNNAHLASTSLATDFSSQSSGLELSVQNSTSTSATVQGVAVEEQFTLTSQPQTPQQFVANNMGLNVSAQFGSGNAGLAGISGTKIAEDVSHLMNGGAMSDGMASRWGEFVAQIGAGKGALVDINSLVQAVLRDAYMENTKDLHFYAKKVQFFNKLKKAIREETQRARDFMLLQAGLEDGDTLAGGPFFGTEFELDYMNGDIQQWMQANGIETIDTVFQSDMYVGDQATGTGSDGYDPLAVRLGDGDLVVDTPDGSFILTEDIIIEMNFTANANGNSETGGLNGIANQILALLNDGDPSNDYLIPHADAPRQPNGDMGFYDPNASPPMREPTKQDVLEFLTQEINNGNIALSGWCKTAWDNAMSDGNVTLAELEGMHTGIFDITVEAHANEECTQWFSQNAGIFVHDDNGDGDITRDELFGDTAMTGRAAANGYDDMAALYDSNNDGVVNAQDEGFDEIQIWQDLNEDGQCDAGELQSLAYWGIAEIDVSGYSANAKHDASSSNVSDATIKYSDSTGGIASQITTKAELDEYINKLESDLNSVGDDAQLANVDLQNMLQKQQQTLQMMSNISKQLHDTAMAVNRKIGG